MYFNGLAFETQEIALVTQCKTAKNVNHSRRKAIFILDWLGNFSLPAAASLPRHDLSPIYRIQKPLDQAVSLGGDVQRLKS